MKPSEPAMAAAETPYMEEVPVAVPTGRPAERDAQFQYVHMCAYVCARMRVGQSTICTLFH